MEPAKKKPTNKRKENLDNFYDYARTNPRDIVCYILMILGIILMFFNVGGGLLIGLVVGLYFNKEIVFMIKNYEGFIDTQGLVRSLIIFGTLLAFFIAAPTIFIGAAVMVALKLFLTNEK